MTPEEARAVIDGIDYDSERDMCGAFQDRYAPYTVYDMAETIAGLRYEYAAQVRVEPDGKWHTVTRWQPDPRPVLPKGRELEPGERIVRRLVSDPEVVE